MPIDAAIADLDAATIADLDAAAIADLDNAAITNLDTAAIVDLAAALLAVEELYCDYPRDGLAIVMVLWVLKCVVWLFLVLIEWVLL